MLKVVTVHGQVFELYKVGNGWSSRPQTVLDVRRRLEEKFAVNHLTPAEERAIDAANYPPVGMTVYR